MVVSGFFDFVIYFRHSVFQEGLFIPGLKNFVEESCILICLYFSQQATQAAICKSTRTKWDLHKGSSAPKPCRRDSRIEGKFTHTRVTDC
jgi:hypothetical protein